MKTENQPKTLPQMIILFAMTTDHDYIPRGDAEFDDWQSNFMTYLTANIVAWGMNLADLDYVDLTSKQTDWVAKYTVGKKSTNPTHPQVVAKGTSRHAYEPALRIYNKRRLVANPVITDADRASLGTTIPDHIRTRADVPAHAPTGVVHEVGHLYQVLRLTNPDNPTSKEKPAGVRVTRIYQYIGAAFGVIPPGSVFSIVGNTSTFEYTADFDISDVGKTANYFLQYENTHGETGPQSAIFSAVIA